MMQLFLDCNIVIDVLANRQPFAESASILFDLADKGNIKLYISAISYSNIFYILRKAGSAKQTMVLLNELEALCETVDVSKQVIREALNGNFGDFEDAIQYYAALNTGVKPIIVTRNPKDFKASQLPVLTADEALSLYQKG